MRKTPVFGHATLLAGALLLLVPGTAAWAGDANLMPRILVTGEGSVDVAPDMAVLKLTVTREAATASEALNANSAAMKNVLEAMQSQGVEARDLQTSGFSIQPRYSYPPQRSSREQEAPRPAVAVHLARRLPLPIFPFIGILAVPTRFACRCPCSIS